MQEVAIVIGIVALVALLFVGLPFLISLWFRARYEERIEAHLDRAKKRRKSI